jgi:hypothetical protein
VKKIDPSDPNDVPLPPGPIILLDATLLALLHQYGECMVRRRLARLTTGAPSKEADKLQIWLTVELFLASNPGTPVPAACAAIAKYRDRAVMAHADRRDDIKIIEYNPKTGKRIDPKTIERIHSCVQKQLREALDPATAAMRQLPAGLTLRLSAYGGISQPGFRPTPNFPKIGERPAKRKKSSPRQAGKKRSR